MNVRIVLIFSLVLLVASCAATGPGDPSEKGKATVKVRPNVDPKITIAYELALVSMRAGNTTKAEKQFKKLADDYPQYSGPHNSLGILYYRDEKIDEAIVAFNTALKINPDSVVSLNYLGIISRGKGEFEQAQGYYEKALQADRDYAYAHLNYGILLELYMGKLPEALKHYKRYQELTKEEDKKVNGWIIDLGRRVKN
ncbi:MAG: tetratricopeptide repeat protein [Gammaproteobacteria bacterium]|nr:tetratricopeptide repeat protein [Gammaproteobacteria bacterium]